MLQDATEQLQASNVRLLSEKPKIGAHGFPVRPLHFYTRKIDAAKLIPCNAIDQMSAMQLKPPYRKFGLPLFIFASR